MCFLSLFCKCYGVRAVPNPCSANVLQGLDSLVAPSAADECNLSFLRIVHFLVHVIFHYCIVFSTFFSIPLQPPCIYVPC